LLARLLGLEAAYHREAVVAPPAGGLVAELGDLDAAARSRVAQVSEPALDGAGQAGDDDKPGLLSFEPFNQAMIVKPLVWPRLLRWTSRCARGHRRNGFERWRWIAAPAVGLRKPYSELLLQKHRLSQLQWRAGPTHEDEDGED
jgi:hypothetical protein